MSNPQSFERSSIGQYGGSGPSGFATGLDLYQVRRRRVAAFFVDYTIIAFLCAIMAVVVAFMGVITFGLGWLLFPVLVPAVALVYIGLTLGGDYQATPGMRLFDLKILRNDNKPVDFWLAAVYACIFWVTLISVLVLLISLFMTRKELLQDWLLGTVVVRA